MPEGTVDTTVIFGYSSAYWKLAKTTDNNCVWSTTRCEDVGVKLSPALKTMRLTIVIKMYTMFPLPCPVLCPAAFSPIARLLSRLRIGLVYVNTGSCIVRMKYNVYFS
jgi:hypothetical protein